MIKNKIKSLCTERNKKTEVRKIEIKPKRRFFVPEASTPLSLRESLHGHTVNMAALWSQWSTENSGTRLSL